MVVGDARFDGNQFSWEGRAFVYRLIAGVWSLVDTIAPPAGVVQNNGYSFAWAVACSNNRIALGAHVNINSHGAIFTYSEVSPNRWGLEAVLDPSPSEIGDQFGSAIAMDGNVLVTGKIRNTAIIHRTVRAYVYEHDPVNSWTRTAILRASDGTVSIDNGDFFGASVDVEGDTIVVGALRGLGNGTRDGAVYVFRRDAAGNWPDTENERYRSSDAHPNAAGLGFSVSIGDGIIASGSAFRDGSLQALYIFSGGDENDLCLPANGSGATAAHLDTFGDVEGDPGRLGLVLSQADPGTRYVVHGGFLGSPTGCGRVIGGMDLCLCSRPVRVGAGVVSQPSGLHFIEPSQITVGGTRLLAVQDTVYLQAITLAPGGLTSLTNAIEVRLRR